MHHAVAHIASLVGVVIGTTSYAAPADFAVAFDVCTSHTHRIGDRATMLEAAGWIETRNNSVSDVFVGLTIGAQAVVKYDLSYAVENGMNVTNHIMKHFRDSDLTRIFFPDKGIYSDIAVALIERNLDETYVRAGRGFGTAECFVAAAFKPMQPKLLTHFDPTQGRGDLVGYSFKFKGPLGIVEAASGTKHEVVSLMEIEHLDSSMQTEFGILYVGPFVLVQTRATYATADEVEIYAVSYPPDPRYKQ